MIRSLERDTHTGDWTTLIDITQEESSLLTKAVNLILVNQNKINSISLWRDHVASNWGVIVVPSIS